MSPESIRCPRCGLAVRVRSEPGKKWKCPKCKTALHSSDDNPSADPPKAPASIPFVARIFAQFVLGFYLVILCATVPIAVLLIEPIHQNREFLIIIYFFLVPLVCIFVGVAGLLPFSLRLVGRTLYYKVSTFFPEKTEHFGSFEGGTTVSTYHTPIFGKKAKLKAAVFNTLYWFRGWMLLGCVGGTFFCSSFLLERVPNGIYGVVPALVGAILIRFAIGMFMMDFISEIAPAELKDYRRVLDSGVTEEQVRNGPGSTSIEFGWVGWLFWS